MRDITALLFALNLDAETDLAYSFRSGSAKALLTLTAPIEVLRVKIVLAQISSLATPSMRRRQRRLGRISTDCVGVFYWRPPPPLFRSNYPGIIKDCVVIIPPRPPARPVRPFSDI